MKITAVLLSALLFVVVVAILPLPIPSGLDFQVIYHADAGLRQGIPVYDHAGQVNMIARQAQVRPDQVYVLPFPYPPWYALITLWMAWLPIDAAARTWLALNLLMLLASVLLLTDGWEPLKRLAAGLAGLFFIPTLGTLLVGQYVLPILLGVSIWIYAIRRQKGWLAALALALLTFKPHLGGILILFGLIYLFNRRDEFGRRTLIQAGIVGGLLFCIGFLADSAWPLNYLHSLLAFRGDAGVSSCGLCASLPVALAGWITRGAGLGLASLLGLLIFLMLLVWWGLMRRAILRDPAWAMSAGVLFLLLASPYLLNYDFVLLLVPMLSLLAGPVRIPRWIFAGVAYLIPLFALLLLGRRGNFLYSAATLILLALVYDETRRLDISPPAAYNPVTTQ